MAGEPPDCFELDTGVVPANRFVVGDDDPRAQASHEVIPFESWAGDATLCASFYSSTAPEPAGLTDQPLRSEHASWSPANGSHLALLAYESLRASGAPRQTLLDFLESAYRARAAAAGRDRRELASTRYPAERLAAAPGSGTT